MSEKPSKKSKSAVLSTSKSAASSSYKPGDLASWLSSAKDLGNAKPVEVYSDASDSDVDESDSGSEFSENDELDIDERVLHLRRLADGDDWMAEYEELLRGEADSDFDDEEDDDEDDSSSDNEESKSKLKKPSTKLIQPSKQEAKVTEQQLPSKKKEEKKANVEKSKLDERKGDNAKKSSAVSKGSVALQAAKPVEVDASALSVPLLRDEAPKKSKKDDNIGNSSVAQDNDTFSPVDTKPVSQKPTGESRPKRVAFVPVNEKHCVFVGNLPLTAHEGELRSLLKPFGNLKNIFFESNNSGAPAGFGYVEFESSDSVSKAASSGELTLGDRKLNISAFSNEMNYRNPDGSRRRDKKKDKLKAKLGDRYREGPAPAKDAFVSKSSFVANTGNEKEKTHLNSKSVSFENGKKFGEKRDEKKKFGDKKTFEKKNYVGQKFGGQSTGEQQKSYTKKNQQKRPREE